MRQIHSASNKSRLQAGKKKKKKNAFTSEAPQACQLLLSHSLAKHYEHYYCKNWASFCYTVLTSLLRQKASVVNKLTSIRWVIRNLQIGEDLETSNALQKRERFSASTFPITRSLIGHLSHPSEIKIRSYNQDRYRQHCGSAYLDSLLCYYEHCYF